MKKDNYKITDKYVIFHGSFLSNWYPCEIVYEGKCFNSSEQLFMWFKAIHFDDYEIANKILESSDPKSAKLLGRMVQNFDEGEWNKVKEDYMYSAIISKFDYNKNLKKELLRIGKGKNFVEGSPYDKIWGVGIDWRDPLVKNSKNWKGENLLGKCLDRYYKLIDKECLEMDWD